MSSNLPPGVTDSMLPGNRPQDEEILVNWEIIADMVYAMDLALKTCPFPVGAQKAKSALECAIEKGKRLLHEEEGV